MILKVQPTPGLEPRSLAHTAGTLTAKLRGQHSREDSGMCWSFHARIEERDRIASIKHRYQMLHSTYNNSFSVSRIEIV